MAIERRIRLDCRMRNHNVLTIRSNNRHMATSSTTDAHDAMSGDLWLLSFIDNRFAARPRIYTRTSLPVLIHTSGIEVSATTEDTRRRAARLMGIEN